MKNNFVKRSILAVLFLAVLLFSLNSSAAKWPAKSSVGYIDLESVGAVSVITEKQIQNYNVVVFGFVDEDGKMKDAHIETMHKVMSMEKKGTINLVSVGGEHAAHFNFTKGSAENLEKLVKKNNLNGVDFDVENMANSKEINEFAKNLKQKFNKEYFITAAPQLAYSSPDIAGLVIANGALWDFTEDIYDAVFVQAYNSGENFKYANPLDNGEMINEANPYIVAAAYDQLNKNNVVNKNTKILIGLPVNAGAAKSLSNLWNNTSDAEGWNSVVSKVSECMNAINANQYDIDGSQFGGLMAWSISNDACDFCSDWIPKPDQNAVNAPVGYFAENVASLIKK